MRQTLIIAGKEMRDGMRNRWILATTLLLAAFALTLAFLGATPTGAVNVSPLAITIVSLSSLSIFLLPLIALLLSYDAIVGEVDRGTMALLLAYPVTRWQVVIGKFLGHLGILAFATLVGFGAAGFALWLGGDTDPASWRAFAVLMLSSVALGGAFLAIGYVVSIAVRDRGTAGRDRDRCLAAVRADLRHGVVGRSGGRPGAHCFGTNARYPAAAQSGGRLSAAEPDWHRGSQHVCRTGWTRRPDRIVPAITDRRAAGLDRRTARRRGRVVRAPAGVGGARCADAFS